LADRTELCPCFINGLETHSTAARCLASIPRFAQRIAFYHIALRGFEATLILDACGIRGILRFWHASLQPFNEKVARALFSPFSRDPESCRRTLIFLAPNDNPRETIITFATVTVNRL